MIRSVSIRRKRPTLRRGEPSREEKETARTLCYAQARGFCRICGRYAPLNHDSDFYRGNLCHGKSKRRFGWWPSEETGQFHFWAHGKCHMESHNCGGKPVAITKAAARAAAELERLASQPDDAQPQSESQQLPAPLSTTVS